MALRAGSQRLPCLLPRKALLRWGGAFTIGLAAVSWRSIVSGDIRAKSTLSALQYPNTIIRNLNFRTLSTFNSRTFFSAISSSSTMSLTPPQPPPSWDHSAEDITRLTKELIDQDRAVQDKIGALAPKDCNFSSVSLPVTNLLLGLFTTSIPGVCECT